jgi:hypothetical protein
MLIKRWPLRFSNLRQRSGAKIKNYQTYSNPTTQIPFLVILPCIILMLVIVYILAASCRNGSYQHCHPCKFKTGLFCQSDPKVHIYYTYTCIWQAWRMEFSYKDIRDHYTRLKGRVRQDVPRTRHFNRA